MGRKNALNKLRGKLKSEMLGEDELSPMGVTVEADSEEGLEKGLDMAKEVVEKGPQALSEELPDLDSDDLDDLEDDDEEDESEEIIAKLQADPILAEKIKKALEIL